MLVVTAHCFCGYGIAHMIARQTNHSAEQGSLAGLLSSLPRVLPCLALLIAPLTNHLIFRFAVQACCQVSRCACWGWVQPLALVLNLRLQVAMARRVIIVLLLFFALSLPRLGYEVAMRANQSLLSGRRVQ